MHPVEKSDPDCSTDSIAEILLVEDDPMDAELTLRALRQCGLEHRVKHVTDGDEALEYVHSWSIWSGPPDAAAPRLILLDLGLHKIGGLHVVRQLKSNPRTLKIPVVALTSSTLAIEIMESYQLGINSYVIKPTDARKFAEVVANIGRYWLSINEPPPMPGRTASIPGVRK